MKKNNSQPIRSKGALRLAILAVLLIAVGLMLAWSSATLASASTVRYSGIYEVGYPVGFELPHTASLGVHYSGTYEDPYPPGFELQHSR